MKNTKGKVVAVNGNMISVVFDGDVSLNEVGYVEVAGKKLKSEVIRIRGGKAQLQVYEMTKGIKTGDLVEFTGELLSGELGPGLLGQVFDGLQNPLPRSGNPQSPDGFPSDRPPVQRDFPSRAGTRSIL